jgi:Bacterial SH3 domain
MAFILQYCVVFVMLCLVLVCGGCIKPHNYQDIMPNLTATGTGPVVIVTHDQRPYVVSGGTNPALVGLVRSPAGIPYSAYTQSGHPLADEMTEIISHALSRKGFQCRPVLVPASMRPDEVRRKLQEYTDATALLLVLHEWKSDTHTDTALAYDATLSVFDPHGVALAETHMQGRDVLGDAFFGNVFGKGERFAATAVPQALQKKLEELLNDPMIITALQTGKHQPAVPQQVERQPVTPLLPKEHTATLGVVQLQHQYDAFRLFLQPNTGAERLNSVSAGVPLKVIEDRDQWLYIETLDEKRGWILKEWTQE